MRTQFGGQRKLAQKLPERDNRSTIFDGHEIMRYIKDIVLVPIPMFDRRDHPSVPTCLPRRVAANGGQGWPKATAQRRVASLMAVRCYAILGAGGGHVRTRFPLPLPGVPTSDGKRKWEAHQKACSAPHQRTRSLSLHPLAVASPRALRQMVSPPGQREGPQQQHFHARREDLVARLDGVLAIA